MDSKGEEKIRERVRELASRVEDLKKKSDLMSQAALLFVQHELRCASENLKRLHQNRVGVMS